MSGFEELMLQNIPDKDLSNCRIIQLRHRHEAPWCQKEYIGEITEKMDEYLLYDSEMCEWCKTYIYRYPDPTKKPGIYNIPIRVPGATRGCITGLQIDDRTYKIIFIAFEHSVAFGGPIACYKPEIMDGLKPYMSCAIQFCD